MAKTERIDDVRAIAYVLRDLYAIQRGLAKIDTDDCNGDITPRQKTRRTTLLKTAAERAALIGLKIYHQSDPRGCSLYLVDDTMGDTNYSNGLSLC